MHALDLISDKESDHWQLLMIRKNNLETAIWIVNYLWKPMKQVDILISKNQALQILYLKHHDNVYKTP